MPSLNQGIHSTQSSILVVSDDASVRRLVAKLVEPLDCRVIGAASLNEALKLIANAPPTLIVLDGGRDDASAHDLCRRVKQDPRTCTIPIVMISSAAARQESRREAIRAGVFECLPKPFAPDQLKATLEGALTEVERRRRTTRASEPLFKGTILLADDDPQWLRLVRIWLESSRYRVVSVDDERRIAEVAAQVRPDCIVLDYQLRTMTAADICRQLQNDPTTKSLPIIVLTSLENERVRSLKIGADYFAAKRNGVDELIANVEACLRRRDLNAGVVVEGDLRLDPSSLTAAVDGIPTAILSSHQFHILQLLVGAGAKGLSRENLYHQVLPEVDDVASSKALEKHLERLKEKVGKRLAERILNIKGFGWTYRADRS